MKKLILLTTAILIFAWSATALADVAPPIKVMLMDGSEIPMEGESYKGRLEITVGAPGELTDFRFESDSWLTVSIEAPASKVLTPGNRLEVPFEVRPLTGSGELGITAVTPIAQLNSPNSGKPGTSTSPGSMP